MSDAAPIAPSPLGRAPLLAQLIAGALAAAVALLSWHLWPEWSQNPDLSHGFFMPAVFVLLLYDSRASGALRWISPGAGALAAIASLLLASLLALFVSGLYAATLGWSHAVVHFTLAASLTLLLGAGFIGLATDSVRLLPLNWNAVVSLALWMLSAPLPTGTYARLTLALQLWVSENVLRVLHLIGIAALRHGNVIELAHGRVGIEEACSGVRSLISCVFAGLFFSATLVHRPWSRVILIALSVPLAIGMNFIRSLTLTLLANRGVDIAGAWHDATGFGVLAVTAALLAGLALLLERREKKSPAATPSAPSPSVPSSLPSPAVSPPSTLSPQLSALSSQRSLRTLAAGLVLSAALVAFFVLNTRPSLRRDTPPPNLYAVLPAAVPGWDVRTTDDLYQFSALLQTDVLAQRTYEKRAADNSRVQVTIYAAYWSPGQASVSSVASHTPDACWPGTGWSAITPAPPNVTPVTAGRTLAPPEYRLFQSGNFPQHVWFWHLFDGRPIAYRDPYSATALLGIAWRYGFRRDGDQLFVRISSNVPWSTIADESLLAQFFARTQPLGL